MAMPLFVLAISGTPCISSHRLGKWGVWRMLLCAFCCLSDRRAPGAGRRPLDAALHLQPGAVRAVRQQGGHLGDGGAPGVRLPDLPAAAGGHRHLARPHQGARRQHPHPGAHSRSFLLHPAQQNAMPPSLLGDQSSLETKGHESRFLTLGCGRASVQKFLSHCAPDDPTTMAPQQMSMALLRAALKARGLKAAGNKAALVAELTAARAAETAGEAAGQTPGAPRCAAVITGTRASCQQLALRHCKLFLLKRTSMCLCCSYA